MCCKGDNIRNSLFVEKTTVFQSGHFVWLSVSKGKSGDPVTAAESALSSMKGYILKLVILPVCS